MSKFSGLESMLVQQSTVKVLSRVMTKHRVGIRVVMDSVRCQNPGASCKSARIRLGALAFGRR